MTSITTKPDSSQPTAEATVDLFDNWFDPIETGVRERVREFIHAMIEGELDMSLSRPRYARGAKPSIGHGEGAIGTIGHRRVHRSRSLLGSFGRVESRSRAPGSTPPMARRRSGRARRCGPISGARLSLTR
jgi:hypothetical protein